MIDNAWDADATEVRVTLPDPLTGHPIIVEDDGTGMTEQEVRSDYLAVASDRSSRKGERTVERHRVVKGRKGIGKFAGLMAADVMAVETKCRGTVTHIVIRKEDLHHGEGDLETIDLPVEVGSCEHGVRGTTVTLSSLSQAFDPPSAERLKPLLMLEYGRQQDFSLIVNGEPIGVDDIPGQTFEHAEDLATVGHVRLQFTISEGKKALRQSGVALRVSGKVVGKPTAFGLEEDEEIPPKLLKKVYGELEADGLLEDVSADWGAVVENSKAYSFVSGWAAGHLKKALATVFANEVQLARARLTQQVQRRLAQLPEHRRTYAEQKVERVLTALYGEKEERVEIVVSVALDAIEQDAYFNVVKAIDEAKDEDVARLAHALDEFGLVDMAVMGDQARRRLEILDQLDALAANPATREMEMHVALEHNLWVLGAEFSLLSSNKTLKRVIEEFTGRKYSGPKSAERPDLLLIRGVTDRHVLIEFKRPDLDITRQHEAQAISCRDELITRFPGIDILLIGRGLATRSDRSFVADGLVVTSYAALISRARAEISWLLDQLSAERPRAPGAGRPSLALQVG